MNRQRCVLSFVSGLVVTFVACVPASLVAQDSAAETAAMSALEATSAINTYTTFMMIGTLADASTGRLYERERIIRLAADVAAGCTAVNRSLRSLHEIPMDQTRRRHLDELESIHELLARQATALRNYTERPSPTALSRYQNARSEVWPRIRRLFPRDEQNLGPSIEQDEDDEDDEQAAAPSGDGLGIE